MLKHTICDSFCDSFRYYLWQHVPSRYLPQRLRCFGPNAQHLLVSDCTSVVCDDVEHIETHGLMWEEPEWPVVDKIVDAAKRIFRKEKL